MTNTSQSQMPAPTVSVYRMTVDLNVLDHLGINLYSNIAAVLTEVVANAWDADAENVNINIDLDHKWIEIIDDGVGMTIEEMNDKYLRVGYKRREKDTAREAKTPKNRLVMGRKGLGKLSLFSIAKQIEVQSFKQEQPHGLRMSVDKIRELAKQKKKDYYPEALSNDEVTITHGTAIKLQEINRKRLDRGIAALRKRLARRFSIIGKRHNFNVSINKQKITMADREDLSSVQFLWMLGNFKLDKKLAPNIEKQEPLPQNDDNWQVNGWIGTAKSPKQLDNKDVGNLNGIVVFARGRLFQENILDKINDGRWYTKYLTGQIEADFLDSDEEPDIATSDRQRIQEDDYRYKALLSFLITSLAEVEKQWTQWRGKSEVKKINKNFPKIAEWLNELSTEHRESAEALIAKLSSLPIPHENDRNILYRHGFLAFERMRLCDSVNKLVSGVCDVDKLLPIIADRDAFEASLYRDIITSRLDVINEFKCKLDKNAMEKVLQKYIFDHLWLLDPAWERIEKSERMETRLAEKGIIGKNLTEEERRGRVDIAYRTMDGKHIIVELKKADRTMNLIKLQEQGEKYVNALEKILHATGEENPSIDVIFVLGTPVVQKDPARIKTSMAYISPGSRIVYYESLLQNAYKAYSKYLDESKKLDRIEGILNGFGKHS